MGFVAILGIISLIGMVIRNSVILIVQIDDQNIDAGEAPWQRGHQRHRPTACGPILLTAAAAILGMIPYRLRAVFWGPMAYAVMGGLAVATAAHTGLSCQHSMSPGSGSSRLSRRNPENHCPRDCCWRPNEFI